MKTIEKMCQKARRKGILRVIIMSLVTVTLMASLFGCGKSDTAPEEEKDGLIYVPEYQKLAFEARYISQLAPAGDEAYMAAMVEDKENEGYKTVVYQYNLLENTAKELSIADLDGDVNVNAFLISGDGNLVMVVNQYQYEEDENGEIVDSSMTMELRRISVDDGTVINSQDLANVVDRIENSYIQYLCEDGQGNLYLCDGDQGIHIVDKDFNKLCDISLDDWVDGMAASKEGDVYIATYNENGMVLKKVDVAAKKLGEAVEGIEDVFGNVGYYPSVSKSLIQSSSNQLKLIDLETGTSEELFNWMDVDIDGNNIEIVGELSDGRIWTISREYSEEGDQYELVYLTRKKASEVPQKEEIVYGALWLDTLTRRAIIDFNKSNDQYHISVKEYGNDFDGSQVAQFNADLTSQNCPDLIGLTSLDFSQYASKGVLEDMYPYMEKSGLDKGDYLENVLKAFEQDGKLYGIVSQFYITSTLAKESLVGEENGWTLSEMLDFVEKNNPENVFMYGSRDSIFRYCIYNNIDEFIDWETGKCFFEGEEFIRTLEFAAKFPEEVDYNQEEEGISARLRSNKVLLMENTVSSVQEYQMMNGLFGEKVTYIGYPNSERKGNLIQSSGGSFGISAKSKHKEGAWEFVESVISKEYQDSLVEDNYGWGFPIRKEALEKQFENDMTPEYYEDEEGNKVESSKTTWGYDDFQMEIMAATQEDVDAVRGLLTSADRLSGNVDTQLTNIITEEAEPFFKGQKSAADAAGVIQNRIQIYVNENR
ncbi:extracellular solute-binding protein [Parablautia muri]|uniref:Extracellular solute-binding protein n=1 Tax=Parablautia muri TaxID=2320879 RepID=A0A9X5BDF1_9FIRM|nr:extracellular solute-binding protein [Parablautia muri]NBJ91592.1 extracellular solute-binding protein [Parablautia muri]